MIMPLATIRRFFRKPPDSEAIEQKYKPYQKKKEMLQKQVLDKLNKRIEEVTFSMHSTEDNTTAMNFLPYSEVENEFAGLLEQFDANDSDIEALKAFDSGYDSDLN